MKFYVTTPIYYINDNPHLGHAYSTISADVLARWHRLSGDDTFFLTGLDENSIKTAQAADKLGMDNIQEYADMMAERWKKCWAVLNISNDDFIRTTEERHKKNVISFFLDVYKKGDIYKATYEGLYCEGCEGFLLEKDLVDGKCPYHKKEPKHLSEENYFFRLSKYTDQILEHIKKNKDFIKPDARRNEMIKFVEEGLRDISISRPNLRWGITLPIDSNHKFWVWFDALVNYLLPSSYWPADVHIIGKDILRFHSTIWIGMLMSRGMKLPKSVLAHGFFTVNGQKISKSLGNAIDPISLAEKYSSDAIRYYLFRDIPFGEDGDFSETSLKDRFNNELVANYSNLFYRATTFIEKNFGVVPEPTSFGDEEKSLIENLERSVEKVDSSFKNFQLSEALSTAMDLATATNKYFQKKEPWKKIKKIKEKENIEKTKEKTKEEIKEKENKNNEKDAATTLYVTINSLRTISLLLYPFIPTTAERAMKNLGAKIEGPIQEFKINPGQKIKSEMLLTKIKE